MSVCRCCRPPDAFPGSEPDALAVSARPVHAPPCAPDLIAMVASAINDRLQRKLDYVEEERRILQEQLDNAADGKKLAFTADQRRDDPCGGGYRAGAGAREDSHVEAVHQGAPGVAVRMRLLQRGAAMDIIVNSVARRIVSPRHGGGVVFRPFPCRRLTIYDQRSRLAA
jgi:hypothetical protein